MFTRARSTEFFAEPSESSVSVNDVLETHARDTVHLARKNDGCILTRVAEQRCRLPRTCPNTCASTRPTSLLYFSLSRSLFLSRRTPALSRSRSRALVRCVGGRYCDKYLSRRRATLIRKKSNKPIDYLSFSPLDCLLTVHLHYTHHRYFIH